MITMEWYDLVAIVAGFLFFIWASSLNDNSGFLAGLGSACVFILAIIFYAVWGGIFWW